MALDDYFSSPSQDCLARLFDAVNSMDISQAPRLSRYEKLIMRTSERKDLFIEKYEDLLRPKEQALGRANTHRNSESIGSHSSFEEGIMIRTREEKGKGKDSEQRGSVSSTASLQGPAQHSPSDADFSLDGSAVWVENHPDQLPHLPSSMGSTQTAASTRSGTSSVRGRKSTDASSTSSLHRREDGTATPAPNAATPVLKDTHFFPATITYNDHQLPIRLPMYTFPEEVGDVRCRVCSNWYRS